MFFMVRYANIVLKKADIPLSKRAGELTEEDTEKLITIMQVGNFTFHIEWLYHLRLLRTHASIRSPTGSLTGRGTSRMARPTR